MYVFKLIENGFEFSSKKKAPYITAMSYRSHTGVNSASLLKLFSNTEACAQAPAGNIRFPAMLFAHKTYLPFPRHQVVLAASTTVTSRTVRE
jgi:hypothetical protein